jgi:hypothetical protein
MVESSRPQDARHFASSWVRKRSQDPDRNHLSGDIWRRNTCLLFYLFAGQPGILRALSQTVDAGTVNFLPMARERAPNGLFTLEARPAPRALENQPHAV